jgi:hypothetical protein
MSSFQFIASYGTYALMNDLTEVVLKNHYRRLQSSDHVTDSARLVEAYRVLNSIEQCFLSY